MKYLFIPAKLKFEIDKSKILEASKKIPKNIVIAYSIQYENQAREIRKIFSKNHNIIKSIQVLGCSLPKFPKSTGAIILMGDGRFHAVSLAYETKLPIYLIENNSLIKISDDEIRKLEKRKKGAYMKFLRAEKVGILVSLKSGQQNLKKAIALKKKLNKNSYILIGNNISTAEFDNFGLDVYINTACPRMDLEDARIINVDKLNNF